MTQSFPHGESSGSSASQLERRRTDRDPGAASKTNNGERFRPAITGFVLMDSSQNVVAFNSEAVKILCYPDIPSNGPGLAALAAFLAGRIRSLLFNHWPDDHQSSGVTAFKSGRRLYFCRVFDLAGGAKGCAAATLALLMERSSAELTSISEVVRQFNLSSREREAVEYLLMGLTSKEISDRMKISVNTVKAFLRLIMVKMGVCTRSGIAGKIVTGCLANGFSPAPLDDASLHSNEGRRERQDAGLRARTNRRTNLKVDSSRA
jgi:DNA-binding CsgD family transcriptional regulator